MGNIENRNNILNGQHQYKNQQDLIAKLHFIQSILDPNLGPIKIYRFKQAPYDYIMKQHRHFIKNASTEQLILQTLNYYQHELAHKNISKLHMFNIQEKYQMCNKAIQISAYTNYYSITLQQVILEHRKNDIRFTEQQIWYVIKTMSEVYQFLNSKNYFLYESFRTNQITLSAQGYIKLFPFHLSQDLPTSKMMAIKQIQKQDLKQNKNSDKKNILYENNICGTSLLYQKAMENRSNLWEMFPLPPEYLSSIKQGNHQFTSVGIQKEQSFLIGMTILSMLIDQDIRKYYNYNICSDQFCSYKYTTIWKDLGIIKRAYPYICQILQKMLDVDPKLRISSKQIIAYISERQDNLMIGGSIRMFDDNSAKMKHKLSYRTSIDFESSVLQGLEPNLLDSKYANVPIQTLTKRQTDSSKDSKQRLYKIQQQINVKENKLKIGSRTIKSKSIRIDTGNRNSVTNSGNISRRVSKTNSLLQNSGKNSSSMSLQLENSIIYGFRNQKKSYESSHYRINNQQRSQQNINSINITRKQYDQKGLSLTDKGSGQKKDKQNKHKMSRIKLNSRRGSSLALKINLQ